VNFSDMGSDYAQVFTCSSFKKFCIFWGILSGLGIIHYGVSELVGEHILESIDAKMNSRKVCMLLELIF
jgi:hypothetical protein